MATRDIPASSRRGLLSAVVGGATAVGDAGLAAAGRSGNASPPARADAELLRLRDALLANTAASERLAEPYYAVLGGWPPEVAAELRALTDAAWALRAEVAAIPAATPAGLVAKAKVALLRIDVGADGEPCDEADTPVLSLLHDVLRLEGR